MQPDHHFFVDRSDLIIHQHLVPHFFFDLIYQYFAMPLHPPGYFYRVHRFIDRWRYIAAFFKNVGATQGPT